ncbi:MAG TPA: HEAT repeat domain-containing protein [Pyrinomonadaceae bacterium]|jgi:HEAT repeat protein
MSKVIPSSSAAQTPIASHASAPRLKHLRTLAALILLAGLALVPSLVPLAQRVKDSQSPVNVTGVSARSSGNSTVVTVSADAPLSRTQTWQEGNKFHLILPYAGSAPVRNLPRGVKVNRVSNSLEIVVDMKSGASVTVDPRFNRLNLIVNGGLNQLQNESSDEDARQQSTRTQQRAVSRDTVIESAPRTPRERYEPTESTPSIPFVSNRSSITGGKAQSSSNAAAQEQVVNVPPPAGQTQSQSTASPAESPSPATPAQQSDPAAATQLVPAQDDSLAPPAPQQTAAAPPQSQIQTTQGSNLFSTIFSTTGVAIIISLGLLALVYIRLRPAKTEADKDVAEEKALAVENVKDEQLMVATETSAQTAPPAVKVEQRKGERRKFLRRKSDKPAAQPTAPLEQASGKAEQALEVRSAQLVSSPAALFGAYRVDQEVGKLVLGQPHRMDVLASRAPDDRRAIETSLLKAMSATETDEDGRRRARQALEEYGFLARHSAALLLAQDACERASAARTLGEIGQPAALPFLLEALYDSETIVRTQAVGSIGALRLPSAIGALLDMARRYPEMPTALLSRTLSACSLDCLEIDGVFETQHPLLSSKTNGGFNGEINRLEPSVAYEPLPEFLEDETLAEALERLENTDVEVRTAAARRLGQFQTQTSVMALTALAARDAEAVVRAAAVASLGEIDHESVFAPVLMAFVDEAREVQAAAARALSRLNFNRADAYARIIETADEEALGNVARACIKARMASQAIDRLTSEDRRQAYEAFSLLSLLAKAGEVGPVLDAIAEHRDESVRMAAIRLLGMTGRPEVAQHFRQLAVRDGLPENVRTSLLEVVYKIDQALPV